MIIEFIKDNKTLLGILLLILVAVFVVVSIVFGIKDALYAVGTWIAASIGIAKKTHEKKKILRESAADRKNLEKFADDLAKKIEQSDIVIDEQINREAATKKTIAAEEQSTLDLLDDLQDR